MWWGVLGAIMIGMSLSSFFAPLFVFIFDFGEGKKRQGRAKQGKSCRFWSTNNLCGFSCLVLFCDSLVLLSIVSFDFLIDL
jgi:hypothetical protein